MEILNFSFPKELCQSLVNWCPVNYFLDIDPQWLEKWKSKKIMKEMLLSSLGFEIFSGWVSMFFNPCSSPLVGQKTKNILMQWNFMIFP